MFVYIKNIIFQIPSEDHIINSKKINTENISMMYNINIHVYSMYNVTTLMIKYKIIFN